MRRTSGILASTAISLVLGSTAAFADLTAAEAWGDWRSYMQGMGYDLKATETVSGNQLTVSDVTIDMDIGDKGGAMRLSMGTLTFVENGDGTVDVITPEVMPINMLITPESGNPPASIDLSLKHSGMKTTMRGSAEDLTYDSRADSLSVTLDSMKLGDKAFGAETAKFAMTIADLQSSTQMTVGDLRRYRQQMSTGAVEYDILMAPPEEPQTVAAKGNLASMRFDGSGDVPVGMVHGGDMQKMLDAGFRVDGRFEVGAGGSEVRMKDPKTDAVINSAASGGSLSVKVGTEGVAYDAVQRDIDFSMQVVGFPFPIAMQMAEGGFNLQMPVAADDTVQDFGLGMNLTGFTMADALWGLFDPTGQLPRDPATIDIDLSGKVKMLIDMMNPEAAETMAAQGGHPAELHGVTVNTLLVEAVGAKLTGAGAVNFDNADMQTYAGMPKPVGEINLALSGGNALIDKLVGMGLLPQEQAMGARMMMGLFAVPGDAPDTLKSKIEFNDAGQILANGQRIR